MSQLPPLRQELTLAASPGNADGSPAWTLYDPAAHRFYQLGWPAFEILSRWSIGRPDAIAAAVQRDTTLQVDENDVLAVAQFLIGHQLVAATARTDTQRLQAMRNQHRLSWGMWLLKHYLFIRVPLFRPMPLLRRIAPYVQWLYTTAFWRITVLAAVTGLYLASQRWDEFVHTFRAYGTWEGLLGIAIALSFAKVLHEFGHALTAYRYGCHVPTMGAALLVLWPVLYTDTNEAWKLRARRERLQIGAAGMLAELALAAYATLLWNFLPDGPIRAGVFMLATSTWIITLTLNASPFTRFDGYYLLSDWVNVPNLHERAFGLARWWLRERLFGFGDPPPEPFAPRRRRFLVAFSLLAWLYRLVLFFSIALLVFHFFFRALGLLLMCVEIGWFIVLPIVRELIVWWRRRGDLAWNRQCKRTAAILTALFAVVFVPLHHSVSAPALLERANAQTVYTPHPALVREFALHEGQAVAAGQVLASLQSPELDYQLQAAQQEETTLRWQVEQQPFNDDLRQAGPALRKRWQTVRQTVAGLRAQIALLTVRAPFAGRVADLNPDLRADVWLRGGERLFSVVADRGIRGEAFVDENGLSRIRAGASADFVANVPEMRRQTCEISNIDQVNLTALDIPYLASVFGGAIPSRLEHNGEIVPLDSVFRVRFDHCAGDGGLAREMPGRVLLSGTSESLFAHAVRRLIAIVRREAAL